MHRLVVLVAALAMTAGCGAAGTGIGAPADTTADGATPIRTPTTPMTVPDPPATITNESALEFAGAHERALLFNRLRNRSSLTAFGVGSTTGSVVDARTAEGVYLRLQTAYWYNENTSRGSLHADAVSATAYLVGEDTVRRVPITSLDLGSFPGPTPNTTASQSIAVINTADTGVAVNLTLGRETRNGTDPVPVSDFDLGARTGGWASPLLHTGRYTVTVTVDGRSVTRELRVDDRDRALLVYVTPDGRLLVLYPVGLP